MTCELSEPNNNGMRKKLVSWKCCFSLYSGDCREGEFIFHQHFHCLCWVPGLTGVTFVNDVVTGWKLVQETTSLLIYLFSASLFFLLRKLFVSGFFCASYLFLGYIGYNTFCVHLSYYIKGTYTSKVGTTGKGTWEQNKYARVYMLNMNMHGSKDTGPGNVVT